MDTVKRGQIRNESRAKQLVDFTGFGIGKITPTDLDGFIEYHGRGYFGVEFKLVGHPLPDGQRKSLERGWDDWTKLGKIAILAVAEHNTPAHLQIQAKETMVREYRWHYQWHFPEREITLWDAFNSWLALVDM